ncbi:MAG TPA: hypothetical protein VIW67_16685 [Terriglobales bacterium]|jgi:hypothetical protein
MRTIFDDKAQFIAAQAEQLTLKITDSSVCCAKAFSCKIFCMPEDELEHLRAILAHAYDPPRKGTVRTIVRRMAKGFFVTPKKIIMKRVQVENGSKDPAKKDAA